MRIRTTIEGESVTVDIGAGSHPSVSYRADIFGNASVFDDSEKLERAIKAWKLSLRKGFTNPAAFYKPSYGQGLPIEVEVTSICEGERGAWINLPDGIGPRKREKVALSTLYASKDEVLAAIAEQLTNEAAIAEAWKVPRKWAPEWPRRSGGDEQEHSVIMDAVRDVR